MNRDPFTAAERRAGHDRRQHDERPQGVPERRTGLEPRQPEVQELELTPSQWSRLFGHDTVPTALPP